MKDAQRKREKILRERTLKPQVKVSVILSSIAVLANISQVRSTGPPQAYTNYRFHELVPLSHLPNPSGALALLTKLSEDPAIMRIMQKHQFSVGVLTELPHEHPQLFGLNVNAGQSIKLRLRTDRYDGFRTYREVRGVLCHELTHNVWDDHDENVSAMRPRDPGL